MTGEPGEPDQPSAAAQEDAPAQPPAARQPPSSPDPWAHRRAEPRTFAFIWTMYLFLATVSTYAVTVTSGVGGYDVIRPAARTLLALIATGIVIVWPLVRFTQEPDRRPVAGPILDLIVVLVPVQAIIWPQHAWWLTGWPLRVVAAVALAIGAWTAIVGASLSISHSLRPRAGRSGAACMAIVLGVVAATHIPMLIQAALQVSAADPASLPPRPTWLVSPIAGVYELTRDRAWTGSVAQVHPAHWRMIGMLWGLSVALWLIATALRIRSRRGGG